MLGIHALALVREGYKLSIILPNNSDAIRSVNHYIQDNIEYNKLINIYKLNIFDRFFIKLGLSKWVNLILRSADACFVHNAKLIPLIKSISLKPLFAVNHTAKSRQIKFYKKADLSIETHVLNEENLLLYGKKVELDFYDFIRNEIKFNKVEDLKFQIKNDIKQLQAIKLGDNNGKK